MSPLDGRHGQRYNQRHYDNTQKQIPKQDEGLDIEYNRIEISASGWKAHSTEAECG
jgi:hypothetical protein